MSRLLVGSADDFEENMPEAIEHNNKIILIVMNKGKFYAVDGLCTHQEVELVDGKILDFGECPQIVCPAHLGRFNLCTGKPTQKPPKTPLQVYNVVIEDGNVYVEVENT